MRGDELRKLRLEIDQFFIKPIVFPIADGGRRFFVVAAVMLSDVAPQRFDPRARFRFGHVFHHTNEDS